MRVLLDGLHFERVRGTGIKTYSRSVIAALAASGHSIDLLSDQTFPNIKSVAPVDAYFARFAAAARASNSRNRLRSEIRGILQALTSFHGDLRVKLTPGASMLASLHDPEWGQIDRIRVHPEIFRLSFIRALLGLGGGKIRECSDADVLFLTSPIPVLLPKRRNILAVHDVIPLSHPWLLDEQWATVARAFGRTLEYLLPRVDRILCVSDTTRVALLSRFAVDERKVSVTYQPCRYSLAPETSNAAERRGSRKSGKTPSRGADELSREPYILFLGAIEPKKNLLGVLRALERHPNLPRLVVVGQFAWSSKAERSLMEQLGNRVQHFGFLPDREAETLLEDAAAFVFPSITEGFGLPPLEAIWKGVPTVLSDIPVFRELFLDYPVYVDAYQPDDIARGIGEAINIRAEIIESARTFVRERYSLRAFGEKLQSVMAD